MLWVIAFFVTIAVVMVGIRKWKTANDPLYALDERSRKAWERENITLNNNSINRTDTETNHSLSLNLGNFLDPDNID